jgi:hypothetical protein
MNLILLFVLIILLYLFKCNSINSIESFSGALQQLYAKGPQDVHLTSGKYVPPSFPHMLWNNPTRLQNYYPPLHHYFNSYYNHGHSYSYPHNLIYHYNHNDIHANDHLFRPYNYTYY